MAIINKIKIGSTTYDIAPEDFKVSDNLDTLLQGGQHYEIVKINANTLGTPNKQVDENGNALSSYKAGLVVSVSSDTQYGGQYAFLNGSNAIFQRRLVSGTINPWFATYNTENLSLSDLGVTATAAELNYVDGVTSAIQTQLNGKFPDSAMSTDLDTLLKSGFHNKMVKFDANTAGSPKATGASSYSNGIVLSTASGSNYGTQIAFLTGGESSAILLRKLAPVSGTPTIGDWAPLYSVFTGATDTANGSSGLIPAPTKAQSSLYLCANGSWSNPPGTTYNIFTGANGTDAGASGLVPAPAANENTLFLCGNGEWETAYTHPTYTARTGKPTANQTPAFGETATVSQIISNSLGHVTDAKDRTIKIPNTLSNGNTTAGLIKTTSIVTTVTDYIACPVKEGVPYYYDTTYSAGSGLSLSGTTFSVGTIDCGTWS